MSKNVIGDGRNFYESYDKQEIDAIAAQKANAADVYGKTKIDSDLSFIQNAIGYTAINTNPYMFMEGYFIQYAGAILANESFSIFGLIPLKAGQKITVYTKGYLDQVAVIATTNNNGTSFSPAVVSTDSDAKTYEYTTPIDTVCAITSNNDTTPYYRISETSLDKKIDDIFDGGVIQTYNVVSDKFITYAGQIASSTNFCYSEPIPVTKGQIVDLYARGYLDALSMISSCDSAGNNIVPLVRSVDSTNRHYIYYVIEDGYIIVSYHATFPNELKIISDSTLSALKMRTEHDEQKISNIEENPNSKNILSAFDNITCIGDSLTYGAVYTASSSWRQAYVPYPESLARKTGASCQNLARGGATAADAWAEFGEQIIERTNDLTIVYLGTNGGLTDTMETDCSGNDYTQYANTNTGCYAKIIKKSIDLGNRVLLIKVYASGGAQQKATTNAVIEKMAQKFNVPFIDAIDLTDTKYHSFPDGTGLNEVHYNDFGYNVFADYVILRTGNLSTSDMKKIIPI